jgi:putative protein-disulfide isomerase
VSATHLIYFADPMCSWCWGFAPVIDEIATRWSERLPIRLVLGGLRPGETTPMTEEARTRLRGHWVRVTEASGQPFGAAALATPGFVYDTDPAARAVVLIRRRAPGRELEALHRLQRAFYLEGLDITDDAALARFAPDFGLDPGVFAAELKDSALAEETWRDYAISRGAGVTGFPTLIVGPGSDGAYLPVTRGFQPAADILRTLAAMAERLGVD